MEWNKIRKDYIAGKGSYRALAEKYGVPLKNLARRAKAEGWPALREQSRHKAATKAVEAVAEAGSRVDTSLQEAAAALIGKAAEGIQAVDPANAKALKSYSGVLKDLKEVLNLRSELDQQEQEARIARLRAEAERGREDDTEQIAVELGGLEDWAR